jgi:hydrogen peroxide-dependent heme synthase
MNQQNVEEINQTIRYTNWTSFRRISPVLNSSSATNSWQELVTDLGKQDLTIRGAYDLRGLRGDADLLIWSHAPTAELIQKTIRLFLESEFGRNFQPVWSGMGLHRPAEFNRSHVPGFMSGAKAKDWLCIYPFVRSYEWYLLPEQERREMLIEHGQAGHKFPGIVSNTVASFALGDYEWLLALESDELHEIVDMMRELRYTKARLHVREEVPFFTGKQLDQTQIGELYL